jgi:hypothetical protein
MGQIQIGGVFDVTLAADRAGCTRRGDRRLLNGGAA